MGMRGFFHFIKAPIVLPFMTIFAIVGGIAMGHFFPKVILAIAPLQHIIIHLISVCIIPILFTSVTLGIVQFFQIRAQVNIWRILVCFGCMFFLCAGVGITIALITEPGRKIDTEASSMLKQVAIHSAQIERAFNEPIEGEVRGGFIRFLQSAVPHNILEAAIGEKFLQILVFSIIFGIALAFIQERRRQSFTSFLEGIRLIFDHIYSVFQYFMPVVVFFQMAIDFAKVGTDTVLGILHFVGSLYLAFLTMFVLNMFIISYKLKMNPLKAFATIQAPLLVSAVMGSGIAALPMAVKSLVEGYRMDKTFINTFTSLGLLLGQFGIVLHFAFVAIFIAQYYDQGFVSHIFGHLDSLLLIAFLSIVTALAATGASDYVTLSTMALVLEPLGLPLSAFLVLFYLIDYIIDPFRNLILVHSNIAALVLIAGRPYQDKQEPVFQNSAVRV